MSCPDQPCTSMCRGSTLLEIRSAIRCLRSGSRIFLCLPSSDQNALVDLITKAGTVLIQGFFRFNQDGFNTPLSMFVDLVIFEGFTNVGLSFVLRISVCPLHAVQSSTASHDVQIIYRCCSSQTSYVQIHSFSAVLLNDYILCCQR